MLPAAAQITLLDGATLTIGPGASVMALGGEGVVVAEGATLVNQGTLVTDGDLVIEGTLRTDIRGLAAGEGYGQAAVAGEVRLGGDVAVSLAPETFSLADLQLPLILHRGQRRELFEGERLPGPDFAIDYRPGAVVVHVPMRLPPVADDGVGEGARLVVYPNPSSTDRLYLRGVPTGRDVVVACVFDVAGQRTEAPPVADRGRWGIRLPAHTPPSAYVLVLVYDDGTTAAAPFVRVE